ncbi:uncharacterized protein LOC113339683 [Papaver somniferum]|uniref:uncharacterized protein LOC113339683 n=1 Tax=Papaver somniferum TaxID=3469 RepID=UPI000E6FEAE4|nr:uncharacterized protein LOC113339683 [Papaver somniferum]
MERKRKEDVKRNSLRLKATIECLMWLALQQCAFRGHDESKSSRNRGNFIELLKFSVILNENVNSVVLENAPGNSKYTSPSVQKEILSIISNRVRSKIREEIGNAKYCILVDESRNDSKKEQMVIVLRCVDMYGCVQEMFFDIQRVDDTRALTLKKGITKILNYYGLENENMRGQGYDGASNMRGQWNGASDPNVTAKVGEAQSISEEMRSFRFVFVLHLMYKIMRITEILCQSLQKKTLDIVNAMSSVSTTKSLLRELREEGWEDFITTVVKFCGKHDVHTPNMEALYMEGTGRSCQQRDNITVGHHYRVDIFNTTIDCQLLELDRRFPEDTIELLILSSCLDPRSYSMWIVFVILLRNSTL